MATNLATRIALLEQKTAKPPKIFRIVCAGSTPTHEEQKQIDDAEKRGEYIICRLIVDSPYYH